MATKNVTTGGRRAGKTSAQKEAIAQANAKGKTVAVAGAEAITVHEPGKKPVKVPRTQKADAPAQKVAAKDGKEKRAAARKGASKPPVEHALAPDQEERSKGGRPTLYKPEYCAMLIAYFRIDLEKQVEVTQVGKDGKPVTVTETVVNRFPTLTRFADCIDTTYDNLHAWATAENPDGTRKYPEFSHAYARARGLQESLLIEGGMSGLYDSRFASLASKNLIGWRDQVEQTVTATVTQATVDELDQVYAEGMANAAAGRNAVAARRRAAQGGQGE